MKKTIAFHNLGCKVNSYEMEVMRQNAQDAGYEIVQFDQKSDIYVINTCTVTNIADRKSRQMINRAKALNPDAVIVATGCYVETGTDLTAGDGPVDIAIGNNHKSELTDLIEEYLKTGKRITRKDPGSGRCEYETMSLKLKGGADSGSGATEHKRVYVKIQDGCNQFCTYCAIPYARGRVRSRDKNDILKEIKDLTDAGYRELILTGIHISSYGIDADGDYRGESRLIDLVEEICRVPGVCRVRLSSLEPRIITPKSAKRLAALKAVCPHFHLSLQSGCDATLKRMNRKYTSDEYRSAVRALRDAFGDRCAITTDIIAGFPGETDEEFEESFAFAKEMDFYEMHVFQYSRRKGTIADKMPDQVESAVKTERSKRLLELTAGASKAFREGFIGEKAEVLIEEKATYNGKEYFTGHTREYIMTALPVTEGLSGGDTVSVCLEGFIPGSSEILTASQCP